MLRPPRRTLDRRWEAAPSTKMGATVCNGRPRVKRLWAGGALRRLAAAVALAMVCAGCPKAAAAPMVKPGAVTGFQRGVGLGLFATDAAYDYGHLLDEIVAHGATDVLIVIAHYQQDVSSHDIAPRAGYSPSRATVQRTLRQAKARGLRVTLLPIVRLIERTRTEWRGRIVPEAGPDAWFERYLAWLVPLAEDAQAAGVDRLGVGSELLSLERYEGHWREVIKRVRAVYGGKLLYSANWDHFDPIRFWDALDEVGVTGYFELTRDLERPTDAQLAAAWERPRMDLIRLRARMNKPLVITEIGYPSKVTAARYPWDETTKAKVDLALQAQLYDAFCAAFDDARALDGVYFWNWFGFGGPEDGNYTPRHKPAAARMKACLAQPWPQPGARRPPSAPGGP
jgi:hypothetical protein